MPGAPDREKVLETICRATDFMVTKVGPQGGYVWSYLPDLSRRWGEMEAFPTMIWMQSPGSTQDVGQVFLDAYHVTKDEFYYQAAAKVADALISAQHPSGGWNYIADYTGFVTLNNDVANEIIDFLIQRRAQLGDKRLLDAARRGMDSYIALQQPAPQAA